MKFPKHIRLILSKAGVDWRECQLELTRGDHIRLVLPNGVSTICAATPSERRGHLNKASEIRRLLQKGSCTTMSR